MVAIEVNATDNSSPAADKLSIRLKRPNGSFVVFTNGTSEIFFQGGAGTSRLAAQFDASTLSTGISTYTVEVRSHWSDGTILSATAPIRVLLVNDRTSPYGAGFSIAGMQRVVVSAGSSNYLLVDGDGSARYFNDALGCGADEECDLVSPPGDFTILTQIRNLDASHNPTTVKGYERQYLDGSLATYAANGRVTKIRDPLGNETVFTYNASGGVATITDPAGKVITLGYLNSKLRTISDPGSPARVTTLTVNAVGDLTHVQDPGGVYALQMTYDASHRMTTRIDRRGGAWAFAYDFAGKVKADTLPTITADGQAVRPVMQYASHHRAVLVDPSSGYGGSASPAPRIIPDNVRASVTNQRGAVTIYAIDRWGAATRIEEPYGRVTQILRNANAQDTQTVSPSGRTVKYGWTGGNLTQVADLATSKTVTFAYSPIFNQVTRVAGDADSLWNYWTFERLDSTRVGNSTKKVTKFKYGSHGRDTLIIDPEGHETRKFYAAGGWRNIDSVKSMARRTAYTYDAYGRVMTQKDPRNRADTIGYDVLNRVTRHANPLGHVTTVAYDNLFPTSVTDAKGQRYAFARNALGWVDSDTFPVPASVNAVRGYSYDRGGNVTGMINRRSQTLSFTYDSLNNLLTRTADGQTVSFKTDPIGLFTAASNTESTDTLKFDSVGRPTGEIAVRNGTRFELQSTFNVRDLRTMLRVVAPWADTIRYAYTAAMELDTLVDFGGGQTRIMYDSHRFPTGATFPNGVGMTRTFPSVHVPGGVTYNSATVNASLGVKFGFNDLGLVEERALVTLDGGVEYGYDQLRRLSSAEDFTMVASAHCQDSAEGIDCPATDKNYSNFRTYTYDQAGNRSDLGAVIAWGNRLVKFNGDSLVYDADGNLVRRIRGGADVQRLYWNSLGELVAAWTSGADSVSFAYDGFGRRARKWSAVRTARYIYDRDNLLAELDAGGNHVAEYAHFPGLDRPHSVRRGGFGGAMYYYGVDQIGSVTGLMNASGGVANQYRYNPWGGLDQASEAVSNPLRFAAREHDAETGLYFNRARYYDPTLARFISEDPIGLEGGINMYTYSANDPVNFTDPFGLDECGPGKVAVKKLDGTTECVSQGPSLGGTIVTAPGPEPWNPFGPGFFGPNGPPPLGKGPGVPVGPGRRQPAVPAASRQKSAPSCGARAWEAAKNGAAIGAATGAVIAGADGALIGGKAGFTVGTVVGFGTGTSIGPVGSVVGAAVGSTAGTAAGAFAGGWVGWHVGFVFGGAGGALGNAFYEYVSCSVGW
jgi:RHS repeat-associated protein